MQANKIASAFVDLVSRYEWRTIKELPLDDEQILFGLVSAAGFEPKRVIVGKLVGHYRDQDGSSTGETYPINFTCPYKVIDRDGRDYFHATGWLEQLMRIARSAADRDKNIEAVEREIERSIPLTPIQLTPEGDMLREYPPSGEFLVDHARSSSAISSCVGVHDFCGGWMDRMRVTATHDALICRSCHLRVLFPQNVKTYGELLDALASKREVST